ncbi:MAG: hypothetical protein HBSAPP03_28140 [Phycisphaerae bacterium]|nr:MAG: hypothetical protein HBSAPP03_28140 [Phycisphaerae bacterium]
MARAILMLWAAFWGWFIVMNMISDGPPSYPYAGPLLAGVLAVGLIPWRWPRVGGVLAVLFGAYAAWRFHAGRADVLALIAGLPIVTGAMLLAASRWRTTPA